MAVEIVQEVMGLGSWTVDIDWNPAIVAELLDDTHRPLKVHALIHDADGNLLFTGVQIKAGGGIDGLKLYGRNLGWWLEAGNLVNRDYLSGANKLSDDHFQLDIAETASGFLWDFSNVSKWQIVGALEALYPPGNVAATFGVLDKDDILRSTEQFPTKPGQTYTSSATIQLKGQVGPGLLRLRTVYAGRFQNPNLASPYTSWSASVRGDIKYATDPTGVVPGPVMLILTGQPNLILNGSFNDGVAGSLNGFDSIGHWTSPAGGVDADPTTHVAAYASVDTGGGNPAHKFLRSDYLGLAAPGNGVVSTARPVIPGEVYRVQCHVRTTPGVPVTDGSAYIGTEFGPAPLVYAESMRPGSGGYAANNWRFIYVDMSVIDGKTLLMPALVVDGMTQGSWDFDAFALIKMKGYSDSVTGPQIFGVPQRTYRWDVPYRAESTVLDGTVTLRAVCRGPAVPLLIIDGPTLSVAVDTPGLQHTTFDITLPSGYDNFIPQVYAQDVHGGYVIVGQGTITDTDATTYAVDVASRPADRSGYTTIAGSSTAPIGSDTVHIELVAEANSGQWIVGRAGIVRTDLAPATGNAIVAQLLAGLSVTPGVVNCPETIPYDWLPRNLSPWDALIHYCKVVSSPKREFRINPDNTIDVGTAASVFTDRGPDSAYVTGDIDVDSLPAVDTDLDQRAAIIKVIGAERQRTGTNSPILITATSVVPGVADVDWFGNLAHRVKIVSDSTVDHWAYAQALADDLAAKEAEPVFSVNATLTPMNAATTSALDIPARPALGAGDWTYVYDPDNGLSDSAYETVINGVTVNPRRLRVVSLTRQLSTGAITIRRQDGSTFDLATKTNIVWSDKDAVSVVLGQRPPDFISDPQGGNVGEQYLRDRASRPR